MVDVQGQTMATKIKRIKRIDGQHARYRWLGGALDIFVEFSDTARTNSTSCALWRPTGGPSGPLAGSNSGPERLTSLATSCSLWASVSPDDLVSSANSYWDS